MSRALLNRELLAKSVGLTQVTGDDLYEGVTDQNLHLDNQQYSNITELMIN